MRASSVFIVPLLPDPRYSLVGLALAFSVVAVSRFQLVFISQRAVHDFHFRRIAPSTHLAVALVLYLVIRYGAHA
jgi:hypothetical protein